MGIIKGLRSGDEKSIGEFMGDINTLIFGRDVCLFILL